MKFNIPVLNLALILGSLLMVCAKAVAQDDVEMKPLPLGDFNNQGSVTVGYRFTDVKGYRPMFLEMFDLQKGLRLQDFSLFGEAKEGASTFADSYSLSMSGLGGDPFPTAQFTVIKNNLYDFRANWRQSYYYWNQNDNVLLPISVPSNLSTGLTNNHDWATVRKFGSADLTLHASNNLRFNFDYYRTSDDGTVFTTRTMDFFSSPSFWGTFARGNAFYLYAPLHDNTNRITGGLDFTHRSWSFHYRVGYQTFTENTNLNNVSMPEISINGIASSATTPLNNYSSSTSRRLTTPVSEFSFVGKPESKLEWRGGYIYYRYEGPASLDESFNGIAPNSAAVLASYTISQGMRANVTEPNHIVNQGFTYSVKEWWDVNLDYRYSRFTTDSVGNFQSLFSGTGSASGKTETVWRDGLSDLDFNMAFTPMRSLVIRPGIHLMKADVEAIQDGVIDVARTQRTKTVWPEISFSFQPSSMFSIRGSFHSFTNGASYTATTPHTQVGTHLVTRFQPIKKLSVENDLNIVNSKLIDTSYQNNIRSNGLTVTYAWNDRFSFFAGFTYNSFFAEGNVNYLRGTGPLLNLLRDQEVNRVWQSGIEAKPIKRAGLRFTMNFDRSTGVGQIAGEPPAYGPLTWPLGTGTFYYDFPKAGRLSLDLQRTYYKEEVLTVNNFSANLLTIRWTRNF